MTLAAGSRRRNAVCGSCDTGLVDAEHRQLDGVERGLRVADKKGLYPSIFRIDVDAARAFFGDEVSVEDIPRRIVDAYNTGKDGSIYESEGTGEFDGCGLAVYRNAKGAAPAQPVGAVLRAVRHRDHESVDAEPAFRRFRRCGRRVVRPHRRALGRGFRAVHRCGLSYRRRAPDRQPGGQTGPLQPDLGDDAGGDVNFRDPRSISYTESLENVWTALSGQVRPEVLTDPGLRAVFGAKDKMRLEVSSAIKFGPRVDTLDKLIMLIRWLAATAESPLPADDDWAILDSIKVLNPRKSKDLIARLNLTFITVGGLGCG